VSVCLCVYSVTYCLLQSMEVQAEPQEVRGKKKGKGVAKSGQGKVLHGFFFLKCSSFTSG